jgi:hypothetical protein
MNDLEQLIIRQLNDQVTTVRAPDDLAEQCLRRVRVARRRRRRVAGVAAVAAIVVAVPAVLASVRPGGGPGRHTPPATSPAPTATLPAPAAGVPKFPGYPDPVRFRPWFTSLPRGEPSETLVGLPDGPTFRYHGVTYRRPGPGALRPFGVTVQGLLAAWYHGRPGVGRDFHTRVIVLRPEGTFRTLATGYLGVEEGAGVSADGTRVAYSLTPDGPPTDLATVTVQDLPTGQRWTKTFGRYASVTGWSRNEVVVVTPGPRSDLWAPDRGSTRTLARRAVLSRPAPPPTCCCRWTTRAARACSAALVSMPSTRAVTPTSR